jgi:polar amino acid transport system substrate-binding protein
VTVGTEATFPPFEFVKDGKITGYGKDILDYIVADLGVRLDQLDVPFQGLFPGLLAGKFDFIATTLTINDVTSKKFAFTMPIAEGSPSILKRKGDDRIKSAQDLSGRAVATQVGALGEKLLRALSAKFVAEGKAPIDLKLFTSGPEGFLALATGQADAAISLLPTIKVLAVKQPDVYEVVGPLLPEKLYLGWACRPEDTGLRDYLSSKIKELRDNGKLYQWQEKWLGFRMEIPDKGYMPEGGI